MGICATEGLRGDRCIGCVAADTARKGTRLNVDALLPEIYELVKTRGKGEDRIAAAERVIMMVAAY